MFRERIGAVSAMQRTLQAQGDRDATQIQLGSNRRVV
jgi:hypothetical protein